MSLNALSVDLEEYFHVSNFEQVIDRDSWPSLPSRVVGSTHRLLDAFDETGSRATFFVLGWVAERSPELIREISARGHEIACHGYAHQLVYAIGPKRFREDLRRAIRTIEDAASVSPKGYRAPSYSITRKSLWALDILLDEGVEYDSSIFPIHHHRYGIPDFARRPVLLDLGNGRSIREFPMTTIQLGPLNLPVSGGAYLRFIPPPLFNRAFGKLVADGEPTVLYTHPWEIDREQPRQNVPWKIRLNHYFSLGRTEGRLRTLMERHPFSSLSDVLNNLSTLGRLPMTALPIETAQ